MWEIRGKSVDPARFAPFKPLDVLNYYDGERLFTFKDSDDGLCLACWSGEDDHRVRFLVVPVSDTIVENLKKGLLSVSESLDQPRIYAVDLSHGWELVDSWLITASSVPVDAQPQAGAMLHRSLEPLLSLRAIGDEIRAGEIPGSVIKTTIEGAQKAIKSLAEYETDSPAGRGRPSRALQKLYDLPAQYLRAASFEISFRSPLNEPSLFAGLSESEIHAEMEVLERVGDHLKVGLEWLTSTRSDNTAIPVPNDPELSSVIVTALKFLTPSPRGPIRELEIRGNLATRTVRPTTLNRSSRSIVNGAISRIPPARSHRVDLNGWIRELDADRLQFQLRSLDGSTTSRTCKFEPELWDEIYELLGVDSQVTVFGSQISPSSPVIVLDLIRLES